MIIPRLIDIKIEKARRHFWNYCNLTAPDFYKPQDREYLMEVCNDLQNFYESDEEVLVLNLPPRHGKSRTAGKFVEWVLGKDNKAKIMTGSYNETLSTTFSKSVRNAIQEIKADKNKIVFNDIFPNTHIKHGDGAMNLWSLEGGYNNYLATSPTGTATGFGCTCFPKGTKIATDAGEIDIEKIFYDKNNMRILSLAHNCGIIRYNNISIKRRKISNEFIEITTTTGRKIKSTIDHKYYTNEKGYIRADQLKKGYTLKTIQRNMPTMWKAKNGQRKTLLGLLQPKQNNKNNTCMRLLRKEISNIKIPIRKIHKKWVQSALLLKRLQLQSQRRKTKNAKMPDMWRIYHRKKKILFRRMQSESHGTTQGIKGHSLPNVWQNFQTTFTQNKILLNGMQKQSTFKKNVGREQLTFQKRHKLYKRIYRYKTFSKSKRQLSMPNMWSERKTSTEQTIWACNKFKSTPQGRKYKKQHNGKLNNFVPRMSYKIAQDEKIIDIKYISEKDYVYDLQVDRDHNFFANGVLVHNCMIIDDVIKNAQEAYNQNVLANQWDWFTNTMLSRLEEGGKIIIIMTRWATEDLAGKALRHFKAEGKKIKHINMKALQDDGTMLCNEILSRKSYESKKRAMGADIASANYQQEPIDIKGRLYTSFKTYTDIPKDDKGNTVFETIKNYTDTADEGSDYLCSICYGVYNKEAYILDVYFTKQGMEITEPQTAKMLFENDVKIADVESNNGGRGFARNVESILRQKFNSNRTSIRWFHQSQNKVARILSNSTFVMEHIYFPVNWMDKWPEFYESMIKYQREGKNVHDDAQDAITGVAEKLVNGNIRVRFL